MRREILKDGHVREIDGRSGRSQDASGSKNTVER